MANITLGELRNIWRDNKDAAEALVGFHDENNGFKVQQTGSNVLLHADTTSVDIAAGAYREFTFENNKFSTLVITSRVPSAMTDISAFLIGYVDGSVRGAYHEEQGTINATDGISNTNWEFPVISQEEMRLRIYNNDDATRNPTFIIVGRYST